MRWHSEEFGWMWTGWWCAKESQAISGIESRVKNKKPPEWEEDGESFASVSVIEVTPSRPGASLIAVLVSLVDWQSWRNHWRFKCRGQTVSSRGASGCRADWISHLRWLFYGSDIHTEINFIFKIIRFWFPFSKKTKHTGEYRQFGGSGRIESRWCHFESQSGRCDASASSRSARHHRTCRKSVSAVHWTVNDVKNSEPRAEIVGIFVIKTEFHPNKRWKAFVCSLSDKIQMAKEFSMSINIERCWRHIEHSILLGSQKKIFGGFRSKGAPKSGRFQFRTGAGNLFLSLSREMPVWRDLGLENIWKSKCRRFILIFLGREYGNHRWHH